MIVCFNAVNDILSQKEGKPVCRPVGVCDISCLDLILYISILFVFCFNLGEKLIIEIILNKNPISVQWVLFLPFVERPEQVVHLIWH